MIYERELDAMEAKEVVKICKSLLADEMEWYARGTDIIVTRDTQVIDKKKKNSLRVYRKLSSIPQQMYIRGKTTQSEYPAGCFITIGIAHEHLVAEANRLVAQKLPILRWGDYLLLPSVKCVYDVKRIEIYQYDYSIDEKQLDDILEMHGWTPNATPEEEAREEAQLLKIRNELNGVEDKKKTE